VLYETFFLHLTIVKTKHKLRLGERRMKAIYIVLTDSGTLFTKLIKKFTKSPYNHASIALDADLKDIYSFGRKSLHFPLNAGFVKEHPDGGIYIKLKNTTCVVYELRLEVNQYELIVHEIQRFEREADRFTYNFWGLFNFLLPFRVERSSAYFCSEFVATVLKNSGVDVLGKPPGLTAPHDFMKASGAKPVYEGRLSSYRSASYIRNVAICRDVS
jgi:hypothetical protein